MVCRWRERSSLLVAVVLAVSAHAAPVHAAEITRVASSAEAEDPFDLDLFVGFERTQRRGKITRERHQENHIADVIELRYTQIQQQLPFRLAVGIFHDLELHGGASVYFNDDRFWGYPGVGSDGKPVTSDENSTIYNNCIEPNGQLTNPKCVGESRIGAVPIFPVPGQAFRGGLSNITAGVKWAPLNDEKDDTKPKWTLGFDYTLPSAAVNKPWVPTTEKKRGEIGDKVHRFTMSTALSKRLGPIDPYASLAYTLPTQAPGFYTNCNVDPQAQSRLGYPQNCGTGPWSQKETGVKAPHLATMLFGAEFFAFDDKVKHQQVSFDIQGRATYNSEGRYYNELSDAIGKLLYNEEYMTVGGQLGVYAGVSSEVVNFKLKLAAGLYHETEHFLTNESVGKDLDKSCKGVAGTSCVDLDNKSGEINPNFDFRYDMPGRRFRISEVNVFDLTATFIIGF